MLHILQRMGHRYVVMMDASMWFSEASRQVSALQARDKDFQSAR
jgi:hypothetical protein